MERVNSSPPSAAYMRQWIKSALVQIMACRIFGTKPLSEHILFLAIGLLGSNLIEILTKIKNLNSRKCIWKYRLR